MPPEQSPAPSPPAPPLVAVQLRREWAMPHPETFRIPPVADLLDRWLDDCEVVIDPFARNAQRGTLTNDLNPETLALHHMKAEDFAAMLVGRGVTADAVLFDPPYSPGQIVECYQGIGITATATDVQNGALYKRVRDALVPALRVGGIAISFGWNSAGFGRKRGFELVEILLVAHGGAHNDTICVVERKAQGGLFDTDADAPARAAGEKGANL